VAGVEGCLSLTSPSTACPVVKLHPSLAWLMTGPISQVESASLAFLMNIKRFFIPDLIPSIGHISPANELAQINTHILHTTRNTAVTRQNGTLLRKLRVWRGGDGREGGRCGGKRGKEGG